MTLTGVWFPSLSCFNKLLLPTILLFKDDDSFINFYYCRKAFEAAAGFFRTQMSKQLHLRTVPMLRFFYDDSLAYGDKMDQLIYKARVEDNAMIQQEDEAQHENISTVKFQKRERLR